MKLLTFILIYFISISNWSQNTPKRGKLVIRKEKVETREFIRYEKVLDSTIYSCKNTFYNCKKTNDTDKFESGITGASVRKITENIYYSKRKIYFINKHFKEYSHSRKFIKKLRRRAKRNKLHYFELKYKLFSADSIKKEYYTIQQEIDVFDTKTNKVIDVKVNKNATKKERTENKVSHTNFFTFLDDTVKNNFVIDNFPDKIQTFIIDTNSIKWVMNSRKSIYKDKYTIIFELKKLLENKLKIIKNNSQIFICDYKIKGKYIYIENSPIAELSKGKFNNRKTRLRFRIHNTNHDFTTNK